MAAVQAYLEGGPCAGTLHTITPAEGDTGTIICKQHVYKVVSPSQLHNGHPVFKDSGKVPAPPPPTVLKAPHALGGWKQLRKSINHGMPAALDHSQHVNAASLRSLHRAGKVMI